MDDAWDGRWGPAGWVAMAVMMVVFWGAIVALVVYLLRSARPGGPDATERARRILDERLARGEIEPEEYARRRDLLGAS